jgi:hypothetical protein
LFDDLAQFKYPTGNSRHVTFRDDSSNAAESTVAHQSKGTPRNDDDWINFDELQRDPRQFNPFADVDASELVKDLVKYDISSDSDSYDDGSSDKKAARPLSRNNIDQYISAVKEDEDYIQQLHFEDPEALGVLCTRDEWNATRYLGVYIMPKSCSRVLFKDIAHVQLTPAQDATNRVLWDACRMPAVC